MGKRTTLRGYRHYTEYEVVHEDGLIQDVEPAVGTGGRPCFLPCWNDLLYRSGRKIMRRSAVSIVYSLLILAAALIGPSTAAVVDFENCMSLNIINSNPQQLQFTPFFVNATFDSIASSHHLNITVYGNVSGIATQQEYPAYPGPEWDNPKETVGKIPDISSSNNKYTTLTAVFNVLDYTPYTAPPSRFCDSVVQGRCPLAPSFEAQPNDTKGLPAFSVAHDFYSSYAFTTIQAILHITSGEANEAPIACVSASITPDLGHTLSSILTYIPLVVLIFVAIATACAAIYSPWGSTDVFRWTSNYGRDADLLRLVTPGFGDCLQYIQFIVLAGSLSLNYPGFYQPVASKVGWSALLFNESFVTHGNGTRSLIDGVYSVHGKYGLDRMSQLVGMSQDKDMWAGMTVWLLVTVAAVVILIQLGFVGRWVYRHLSKTHQEDLQAKNLPFTIGNSIRIIFNYFLMPIVALSTYQLVIASHSSPVTVGLAAILLFACVVFAAWLLWLIASTRPRSYLFDDLPTVLLYGPLYNTYSDNAAAFALVPVMLTFMRGIAMGGVQPSGIAQLILLAICEVILILTLNAFRPFHSPTSMNAFHTFFAVVRLLIILLSVAFVPSLDVSEGPKGWIAYVILLMHAIVLIFGFFLNACQTLIEVIARLAGAGGEEGVGGGVARGGLVKVFGVRQLSRRNPRRRGQARHSMASDATFLGQDGDQSTSRLNENRSRSVSGSSAILLNRHPTYDHRTSMGIESVSGTGAGNNNPENGSAPYTPTISGASAFSYLAGASQAAGKGASPHPGIVNLRNGESTDPWYRPPRARRPTNDVLPARTRSRGSWVSANWANKRWSRYSHEQDGSPKPMENSNEATSLSGRATPLLPPFGMARDRSDSNFEDPRQSRTDYAVREVDFYYGVRGRALSKQPTRRLKTGPADPTGPVSSASGWFKGLFGGKIKDKGKGFEVVRSSRAPPQGLQTHSGEFSADGEGPYFDEPIPKRTRDLELSDDGDAIGGGTRHLPDEAEPSLAGTENREDSFSSLDERHSSTRRKSQVSQFPPSLPTIETGNGIELPSRVGSKASSRPTHNDTQRREGSSSSLRQYSQQDIPNEFIAESDGLRLSTIPGSPASSHKRLSRSDTRIDIFHGSVRPDSDIIQQASPKTQMSTLENMQLSNRRASPFDPLASTTSVQAEAGNRVNYSLSGLGGLALPYRQGNTANIGYVQKRRASDNIFTVNPDETLFDDSSAQLVDVSSERTSSTVGKAR